MNFKKNFNSNYTRIFILAAIFIYFFTFSAISNAAKNDVNISNKSHCSESEQQYEEKNEQHERADTTVSKPEHEHQNHHHHHHHHKAFHGGKLFEIGSCENGHCEMKINENGTVDLWLVGGGNNTGTSIRTSAEEIKFKCKLKKGLKNDEFDLILKASPIELAEESIGDCSHFTGHHEKLAGKNDGFFANGKIYFKGQNTKIEIDY